MAKELKQWFLGRATEEGYFVVRVWKSRGHKFVLDRDIPESSPYSLNSDCKQ